LTEFDGIDRSIDLLHLECISLIKSSKTASTLEPKNWST